MSVFCLRKSSFANNLIIYGFSKARTNSCYFPITGTAAVAKHDCLTLVTFKVGHLSRVTKAPSSKLENVETETSFFFKTNTNSIRGSFEVNAINDSYFEHRSTSLSSKNDFTPSSQKWTQTEITENLCVLFCSSSLHKQHCWL